MKEKPESVKRAADLLRGGATMMVETCPACGTPLFKVGNEVTCPACNRPVVIVSGAQDEARVLKEKVLQDAEQTLLKKISAVQAAIENESDPDSMRRLTESLTDLLSALRKLRGG